MAKTKTAAGKLAESMQKKKKKVTSIAGRLYEMNERMKKKKKTGKAMY